MSSTKTTHDAAAVQTGNTEMPSSVTLTSNDVRMTNTSEQELLTFLSTVKLVSSLHELQAGASEGLTEPWQTGIVDGELTIAVPSNVKQLVKTNYLINLYIRVILTQGYKVFTLQKDHSPKLKIDGRINTFLQAYGIILVTRKVPELPTNKGTVWKGIASSILTILQGKEKFDISLTKVRNAPKPAEEIFGDVWGKDYPTEKRMLDGLIHYYRTMEMDWSEIRHILIDYKTIAAEKGCNLDLPSDTCSKVESDFLKKYLEHSKISLVVENKGYTTLTKIEHVDSLKEKIRRRQDEIRPFKEIVRSEQSDRVRAAFSPYTGKNREKVRKTPIKELVEKVKGTEAYRAFNPTSWVRLYGLQPLSFKACESPAQNDVRNLDCEKLGVALEGKGLEKDLILALIREYWVWLDDLYPPK